MQSLQRMSIRLTFIVTIATLAMPVLVAQTLPERTILAEYEQLLAAAESGGAEEKLALFMHVNDYSEVLKKYTSVAVAHLAEASNLGNGRASYLLAQMLEHGIAAEQDAMGAEIYYTLGAQQGNVDSMLWLLRHHAIGITEATSDEDRDDAIRNAERWYRALISEQQLARENRARAAYMLGMGRLSGSSIDERGWSILGEAAVAGHPDAAAFIRAAYLDATSEDFSDEKFAKDLVRLLKPVIAEIGTTD